VLPSTRRSFALLTWVLVAGSTGCHRSSSRAAPGDDAGSSVLPAAAAVDVVTLRDGDAYSVSVARAAAPCILYPESLFDTSLCPAEARPMSSAPPGSSRSKLVALGLVRFVDHEQVLMGQLTVSYNGMSHASAPTQATAIAFGSGMVDSLIKSVPGSAVVGGGPSVRLMTTDSGLHLAQISFDMSRVSGDTPRVEHSVSYTAWTLEGAYTFSLTTRAGYSGIVDTLAAQMAASVRVAHPAPPSH